MNSRTSKDIHRDIRNACKHRLTSRIHELNIELVQSAHQRTKTAQQLAEITIANLQGQIDEMREKQKQR